MFLMKRMLNTSNDILFLRRVFQEIISEEYQNEETKKSSEFLKEFHENEKILIDLLKEN